MGVQICRTCGYEGKGVAGQVRKFTVFKILGFLLMLPIATIVKMLVGKGGKYCPHCRLPTMVKLKSDEGWIVQRRLEVRAGLLPEAVAAPKKEVEVFGAEKPVERKEKSVDPDQW